MPGQGRCLSPARPRGRRKGASIFDRRWPGADNVVCVRVRNRSMTNVPGGPATQWAARRWVRPHVGRPRTECPAHLSRSTYRVGRPLRGWPDVGFELTFDGRARSARPTFHDRRTGWADHSVGGQTLGSNSRSMAAHGVPGPPFTIDVPGGPATPWAARRWVRPHVGRPRTECPAHLSRSTYRVGRPLRGRPDIGFDLTLDGRARSARLTFHDRRIGWADHSVGSRMLGSTSRSMAAHGVPGSPFTIDVPGGPATPWAARYWVRPHVGRPRTECPAHR